MTRLVGAAMTVMALLIAGCASTPDDAQSAPVSTPPDWVQVIPQDSELLYFVGFTEGTRPLDQLTQQAKDRARSDASEYLRTEVQSEFILEADEEGRAFEERIVVRSGASIVRLEYPETWSTTAQDSAGRTITRVYVLARMVRPEVYWHRALDDLEQVWSRAQADGDPARLLHEGMLILENELLRTEAPDTGAGARRDRVRRAVEDGLRTWAEQTALVVPSTVRAGVTLDEPLCVVWEAHPDFQWDEAVLIVPDDDGAAQQQWVSPVVDGVACFRIDRYPLSLEQPVIQLTGTEPLISSRRIPLVSQPARVSVTVETSVPVPGPFSEFSGEAAERVRRILIEPGLFSITLDGTDATQRDGTGGDEDGALEVRLVDSSVSETDGFFEGSLVVAVTGQFDGVEIDERARLSALGASPDVLWRGLVDGAAQTALDRLVGAIGRQSGK